MTEKDTGSGVDVLSKEKTTVKHPKQYKVILLNDDYTTMDFVVSVLETIFKKNPSEAVQVMLQVHNRGSGVCGIYVRQVAEAKIAEVHERAKVEGFPLRCAMDEA